MVFDDVKKMQAMKHLRESEAGPNPPPPGTGEAESTQPNEGAVVPYTDTSLMNKSQQGSTQNQLANIIKKAPTMPKPKWHAPWKLYRVIAGHLGWVRCVAVEPGNEVRIQFFVENKNSYKKFIVVVCNRRCRQNYKNLGFGEWTVESIVDWACEYSQRISR